MNSPFELVMLCCFGLSWPFAVYKTYKNKSTQGKSLVFLSAVAIGYVSGIIHKLLYARDFVLAMYVINLLSVSLDLGLYLYYRRYPGGRAAIVRQRAPQAG